MAQPDKDKAKLAGEPMNKQPMNKQPMNNQPMKLLGHRNNLWPRAALTRPTAPTEADYKSSSGFHRFRFFGMGQKIQAEVK